MMKPLEYFRSIREKVKRKNEESFIILKLLYFLCFLSFGVFFPYLYVYLESKNMTYSQTGFIASLNPVACFIVVPIWTILADKYDKHRTLIILSQILAIIFYLLLLVPISTTPVNSNENSQIFDNTTTKLTNTQNGEGNNGIEAKEGLGSLFSSYTSNYLQFIYYIVIYFGSAIFNTPLVSLLDGITMIHIRPQVDRFGKIRMFNGIGWLTGSIVSAIITSIFPLSFIFFNYAITTIAFIIICMLFLSSSYHSHPSTGGEIEMEEMREMEEMEMEMEMEMEEFVGGTPLVIDHGDDQSIDDVIVTIRGNEMIENQKIENNKEGEKGGEKEEKEDDVAKKSPSEDGQLMETTLGEREENDHKGDDLPLDDNNNNDHYNELSISNIQKENNEIDIDGENDEGENEKLVRDDNTNGEGDKIEISEEMIMEVAALKFSQKLKILFSNPRFILFLITVGSAGIAQGIFGYFSSIFVVTILGAENYILGILTIAQTITEIPIFYFSQSLIQRFGIRITISTSLICYIIRLILFSIAPNAWVVIAIEFLHGLSYGLFFVSATIYIASLVPSGLETTGQGALVAVFFGIARACAGIVGGFIFDNFGPSITYYCTALLMFLSLIFFLITHRAVPPKVTTVEP